MEINKIDGLLGRIKYKLHRSSLGLSLASRAGYEISPDRWIFVIGCYNSGTTLLARALSNHPSISGLPCEGVFLTDMLPYPEEYGWPRMWTQCVNRVKIPENVPDGTVSRIKRQWSVWYQDSAPNLLEKSVANITRLSFLQKHFEPAYFVAIIRNGYAVAEGIQRRADCGKWGNDHYEQYPISLCARQWVACNEHIEDAWSNLQRKHLVYYEDFASDPGSVISELTDFLGISMIDKRELTTNWSFQEIKGPIRNMNPDSIARLTKKDLDEIERVAGRSLAKHGYSRPSTY